jgi:hypothetical protein
VVLASLGVEVGELRKFTEALSARAQKRWLPEGNATSDESGVADRVSHGLAASFSGTGTYVDEAIPAFAGLYPFFGGTGTWELLFTRYRLLGRRGAKVLIWKSYTGPRAIRQLAEAPLSALEVKEPPSLTEAQPRCGQLSVAGKRFWVRYEYWPVVIRWLTMEQPPE